MEPSSSLRFSATLPQIKRLFSCGISLIAMLAVSLVIVISDSTPVSADHADPTDSTWMPFIGEYKIWCTLATGVGACSTHHGTWGVDFDTPMNTPIYASGSGHLKQLYGGCSPYGGSCNSGAGNWLSIDHDDHWSRYIHLSSFATGLTVGDWIEAGDLVGYAGISGTNSTAAHLHYDETSPQNLPVNRIFFGHFLACHGNNVVQYPDVLGTTDWQQVPYGSTIRNDGYGCLGSSANPNPDPNPPTVNQISQDTGGFLPSGWNGAEINDGFGGALITGNFKGDSSIDLVVGAPSESVGTISSAGIIHIIDDFPRINLNMNPYQGEDGWPGVPEPGDGLGTSMAAGDFNGDGFDDLIVGSPGDEIGGANNAGMVTVAYGSVSGLGDYEIFHQNTSGIAGEAASGDRFGESVATGDLDGDGFDDVVIGVPGEYRCWTGINVCGDVGAINILYGSATGITSAGNEYITQRTTGISGIPNVGEEFGASVATGDLDGDGFDDVVVGVPGEYRCWSHIGICGSDIGAIQLLYGSATGIRSDNDQYFGQRSNGITAHPSVGDRFGESVATGDIDGDGFDEVILGVPGDHRCWPHIVVCGHVGAIMILYGTANGTTSENDNYWGQRSNGVPGNVGVGDEFGAVVTTGDLNEDGYDDVIIGVPGETVSSYSNAGAVQILYGSASGSTTDGAEMLYASQSAFTGSSQTNGLFGSAIAVIGNDLIIGAPGTTISGLTNAGAIYYHTQ